MKQVNVLILEDDDFEGKLLKEYLEEHQFTVVKVANTVAEAIEVYRSNDVDFMIVEIYLDGRPEGIYFPKMLMEKGENIPPFLFLTGHGRRSDFEEAIVIQPHGFVVKPFNELELMYNIQMILEKHNSDIRFHKENPYAPYFFKKHNIFYKVPADDILCVTVEGRFCRAETKDESFILQHSLRDFLSRLPVFFIRVHRSYVINSNKIKKVYHQDNLIVLEDDTNIPLGRKFKADFLELYETFS